MPVFLLLACNVCRSITQTHMHTQSRSGFVSWIQILGVDNPLPRERKERASMFFYLWSERETVCLCFCVCVCSLTYIAVINSPPYRYQILHSERTHTLVAAINAVCCKELHIYTVGQRHDRLVVCLHTYLSYLFDATGKFELWIVLCFEMTF